MKYKSNHPASIGHRITGSLALLASAIPLIASAQGPYVPSDLPKIYEQRGFCSAQRDLATRSKCFEQLSSAAIKVIEGSLALPAAAPQTTGAASTEKAAPTSYPEYGKFVRLARSNISANMKDPSTVQYRELFISKKSSMLALCGELNAKNSYGAYVGFKRFFATTLAELQTIEDPKMPNVIAGMWQNMCMDKVAEVTIQAGDEIAISAALPKAPPQSQESIKAPPVTDNVCPAAAPDCSWGRKP